VEKRIDAKKQVTLREIEVEKKHLTDKVMELSKQSLTKGLAVLIFVRKVVDTLQSRPDIQDRRTVWEKLTTETYRGKQDDIYFVNDRIGWYANGAGKIYKTSDGGSTWQKQLDQSGTYFRCLAFLDDNHGYAGNIGPGYFPNVSDSCPLCIEESSDRHSVANSLHVLSGAGESRLAMEPPAEPPAAPFSESPVFSLVDLDHSSRCGGILYKKLIFHELGIRRSLPSNVRGMCTSTGTGRVLSGP
jgi:hypothetical protein